MITWYDNLYLDESMSADQERWKEKIEEEKAVLPLYCIAFAANENNLFDILCSTEMLFSYYKKKEMFIVGLSRSSYGAKKLVVKMIEDIYRHTGGFRVREYFVNHKDTDKMTESGR